MDFLEFPILGFVFCVSRWFGWSFRIHIPGTQMTFIRRVQPLNLNRGQTGSRYTKKTYQTFCTKPPGMYTKPCKSWEKNLPTSTGFSRRILSINSSGCSFGGSPAVFPGQALRGRTTEGQDFSTEKKQKWEWPAQWRRGRHLGNILLKWLLLLIIIIICLSFIMIICFLFIMIVYYH